VVYYPGVLSGRPLPIVVLIISSVIVSTAPRTRRTHAHYSRPQLNQ